MARVLIYTVSRADTTSRVVRALDSLREGQATTGYEHEWVLWCNSPQLLEATKLGWLHGQVRSYNGGENVGQHVALGEVLKYARELHYDFIVKVDDDLEWMTKGWLRKLVAIEEECYKFSGRYPLLAPRVLGLKNPIPIAAKIKLGKIPLYVVPIVGGACRLHHISFFDDYVPDVRLALGAGGDTSIAAHAEKIQVANFVAKWVSVRHQTAKMEEADPDYFRMHSVYQTIPYIPHWK